MAIQVGGTTVVDNSRNVCNVGTVNATTVTATSVCGTHYGDGSNLTGVGGGFSCACVFSSTQSWTIPPGITKIKVTAVGAGSGGAVRCYSYAGWGSGGPSGGGGVRYYSVTPGGSACIVVGSGGSGGCSYFRPPQGYSPGYPAYNCPGVGGTTCFSYGGVVVCGTGGIHSSCGDASGTGNRRSGTGGTGANAQYCIPGLVASNNAGGIWLNGYGTVAPCYVMWNGSSSPLGRGGETCYCNWFQPPQGYSPGYPASCYGNFRAAEIGGGGAAATSGGLAWGGGNGGVLVEF